MMISDHYAQKLNRMRMLERERKQRIFNDKQRLIGVDRLVLEDQMKERRLVEQRQQMYEDVSQKNLIFYSEQAIQREQMVRFIANKNAEHQRQLENKLLAHEQRLRINQVNAEAYSNIPTEDYYNYFNTSSR